MRAAAFSWAFSEQFEIGLVSESTIGHVQAHYPQQGFVDHVVTPSFGLAVMIGEDALDRYIIRPLEARTGNKWKRLVLRSALNPARSFANLMDGKILWDRTTRGGIMEYLPEPRNEVRSAEPSPSGELKPAIFEFSVSRKYREFASGGCVGGGADAAYRVNPDLQLELAVNGCKLLGLPANFSGDALIYQIGPRWTPAPLAKWSPYAHFLIGGMKITHEQLFPDEEAALLDANKDADITYKNSLHDQYTRHEGANGLALGGGGVDYNLNAALALRVAGVEYLWSNAGSLDRLSASRGLAVTTGVVLRLGTW